MEDDGGSAMVSMVHPDIKSAMRKAVLHIEKAHGLKPQKVTQNPYFGILSRAGKYLKVL